MTNDANDPNAHPSQDALIDLAAGLLSETEAAPLIAHLRACPDCETRFASVVTDRERARSRAGARDARSESAGRMRGWKRHHTMVAAGLALAAALVLVFYARPVSHTPPGPWLPPAGEGLEQRLRGGSSDEAGVWKGIAAYDARDLNRAVETLSGARPSETGLDHMRRVYLASAYLLKNRPREALTTLQGMDLETLPYPWRGEALWIQAESLSRLGRTEEAHQTLERLSSEPGAAGERARRRLGKPEP